MLFGAESTWETNMQNALCLKTTVLPGGKIEIADAELPSGASVDVVVVLPKSARLPRRSAVEILESAPGHRIFKTAEEVDAYIRKERESWDR